MRSEKGAMTARGLYFSFCFAACLLGSTLAVLPDWIVPCRQSNPKLKECIIDTINLVRPKLGSGIPELGVPPTEPLKLASIRLLRGPEATRLDVNVTDLLVYGPSTFVITDLKVNVDENKFFFKLHFDKLIFKGNYKMDGRILLLPLQGEGDAEGYLNNYEVNVLMKGNKVVRDGKEYLNFEKMKLKITAGVAGIQLNNLFGGDPVLGPATNEVLNENSEVFLDEMKPAIEEALSNHFTTVANQVTRSFTYDELFPL